ncbi:enoyl-CoA hydratase/isomerase family protein [Kocuria coralli]|uniref:Enoyl-CoA hydratase/isomerase family protein n=1 Tax=Kocuria coralli TaxID=1461025 RepID=A0A5J5L0C2_9MICC|nr:enoyl-CoA hydratase/isomerase family protein [Kocuria coralli]KAA9394635.1 enoyl-CoA hydratase/isomerase family protein [Kocuria coralli]
MPTLDVTIDNRIGIITLNNPAALNAWTQQMQRDMGVRLDELDADPEVDGIVITGAGDRAFCSGQDLNEVAGFTENHVEEWLENFRQVYDAVLSNSKPVIAALNGVTAGSGYQLALLCDLRIAHAGVRIGQPEVRSGIPSITGMYLTWQSLGYSKTAEMMLTGRLLDAREAADLGLIAEIRPQEEVLARSIELARELASLPKQAFALTKQRIRATLMPGLEDAFAAALEADKHAYGDGEPQRTAGSFVAKKDARSK